MKKPGKEPQEPWETPSLEWIHKIREDRARGRGGKRLTELSEAERESEFAAGRELARKLGMREEAGPVRKGY